MTQTNKISSGLSLTYQTVEGWIIDFYEMLPNIIVAIIILLLFGVVAYATSRLIASYFSRRDRVDLGNILSDFGFWGLIIFGGLIALTIITPSLNPGDLIASLGIGSLAIGFAFKDILQNWLAGLLILLRLPFRRGDQIKVGVAEGTVRRIEPRATIIRTYDGRDIVVPNTQIYTNMVTINTSQPKRRMELDVTVGYDYPVRRISQIIQNALMPIEEIIKDPAPQVLCWDLGSTSLGIKIRWWISSEKSEETISRARAVQAIKEAFEANDIDPTDPQLIYYKNSSPPNVETSDSQQSVDNVPEKALIEGPLPPQFIMSADDPETEDKKIDSKDETMLPND